METTPTPTSTAEPAKRRRSRPTPVDSPRAFKTEEIFFSVTDKRGVITYANRVFERISAYSMDELLGSPHNMIRHPDMPKCVFHLFWDRILSGKPIAAYVKNMAKDGRYYWVMALAFPCEGGFLSIRIKPASHFFDKVQPLYRELLEQEQRDTENRDWKHAMQESGKSLMGALKLLGFANYEDFMCAALEEEIRLRRQILPTLTAGRAISINSIHLHETRQHLASFFEAIDNLKQLNVRLAENLTFILKLTRSFRFRALNAQIGASRLSESREILSIVAENMEKRSQKMEEVLEDFEKRIRQLEPRLNRSVFDIVAANLQVEMAENFILSADHQHSRTNHQAELSEGLAHAVRLLLTAFPPHVEAILENLKDLPTELKRLQEMTASLYKLTQSLRLIHVVGKIESARLDNVKELQDLFGKLILEIREAAQRLPELNRFLIANTERSSILIQREGLALRHLSEVLARTHLAA